jgi:hypothetical protein
MAIRPYIKKEKIRFQYKYIFVISLKGAQMSSLNIL